MTEIVTDIEKATKDLYKSLQEHETITEPIAKQIETEKQRLIEEYREYLKKVKKD